MIRTGFRRLQSVIGNLASNQIHQLAYVVEAEDWSIRQDGLAITEALNNQNLLRARITYSSLGLRGQIIHFGSVNTFFTKKGWHHAHPSNTNILTWFHVVPGDSRLKLIHEAQKDLHLIHTSCEATKKELVQAGVDAKKLIVIPLGVNLKLFTPTDEEKKRAMRRQLGIPLDRLVIGSFQKDGIGWGEGFKPKLIKGPDIFVDAVSRLRDYNPFVLLTGPARGYVKRELNKRGIPYKHLYLKNFRDLAKMYQALDLYLITSRIEGGPKSLLEAWASGVPVISTRVGMVPDIGTHETDVLLTSVHDAAQSAQSIVRLMKDTALRELLIKNGYNAIHNYDWKKIAQQYFENMYAFKNFSSLRKQG